MKLSFQTFKGIAPKAGPEVLANELAQTAENVRLESGQLKPWFNSLEAAQLVNTGSILSVFLYEDSHWFEWEADVDMVLGLVSADTAGKVYYTGHGIPKKTDRTQATTGAGAKPINFYPMGMPVPHAALTASNTGGGSGDVRSIQYVWTVLSAWSEESAPSPAMASPINHQNGDTVNLTAMTMIWKAGEAYLVDDWVYPTVSEGGTYVYKCVQAGTSGGTEPAAWGTTIDADTTDNTVKWRCYKNNLSYKYIYRYVTGDALGSYQFVTSIAISATTYSDSKTDTQLAESLSDIAYDPPPDDMKGICYIGNGILIAFSGKDVCVSVPYKPWAWPVAYRFSVPAAIVATKAVGETVVILTEEGPFLATGSDPLAMAPVPLPIKVACVAKRGAVSHGTIVAFPGPDGLYIISSGGIQNFTLDRYGYKDWQALYPTTFHATIFGNQYCAFYDYGATEGGIVIDLKTGEITTFDFYPDAVYTHTKTGKFYFINITETEQMPNQVDRDLSAASAWANVDLNAYDETGDLTITATGVGQYCTLPVASAPTTIGKRYRLTLDVANLVSTWTVKSFDGTQTIGTVSTSGTGKTIDFIATTTGGLRIVAVGGTSSGDFDNFSLTDITRYVYEWEGDTTQPLGNFTWKSKKFMLPSQIAFNAARLKFTSTEREAYWDLVESYNAAIARNRAVISNLAPGGTLGEELIGEDIEVAGDDLDDAPTVPTYTGEDGLQLKVYMNGTLVETKEVYSQKPFKITGKRGRTIEVEIIGNVTVAEVGVATSVAELKGEGE
jgi:hypothetical protein